MKNQARETNIKWTIVVEEYDGIRFVMSGKRAKMFDTKEAAKAYAMSHNLSLYQFLSVSEQDYNEHWTFWMAKDLSC